MARTAITTVLLVSNGSIVDPAGTAIDQANGMVITNCPFTRLLLRVANTAAGPLNVILRGGTYPLASEGLQGDLLISVTNATTRWIGLLEGARFSQDTGTGDFNIDFAATFTGTITAFVVPTL